MNVEMVTNIMIQNPDTKEVVIQNRKRKYPGWCFPGGHVERGESIYDCAVREVKEEWDLIYQTLNFAEFSIGLTAKTTSGMYALCTRQQSTAVS